MGKCKYCGRPIDVTGHTCSRNTTATEDTPIAGRYPSTTGATIAYTDTDRITIYSSNGAATATIRTLTE
jgi:hypothetical protein